MSELVDAFDASARIFGFYLPDRHPEDEAAEAELNYMATKADLVRHIRDLEIQNRRLLDFHRQVSKAAGELDGLPEGHALQVVPCFGEDGEPEPGTGFITVGMIRRAAAIMEAAR